MRSLDSWLKNYSEDHKDETNQLIHKICVPVIFFSVVGLIHLIPYPVDIAKFRLGIGDIILTLALVWYLVLSLKAFGIMVVQVLAFTGMTNWFVKWGGLNNVAWLLVALFVLGWAGQFYGHKLEGKKPSFFTDLQYLLIGPLWVWLGEDKK